MTAHRDSPVSLDNVGADHGMATQEAPPTRMAGTPPQVLPARNLAPRSQREEVHRRRQRPGDQVPLPRLPHSYPLGPASCHHQLNQPSLMESRMR